MSCRRHLHHRPRQDLRPHARARRPRPRGAHGRGARLPRPQRRRQVDDHPRPARAAARRRGRVRLLGGDPWRDAAALHRRLAYVPGDVTLWPNLSGGEVIDLLGRLRGGLDPSAARRAARALRARPDEEGPRLLQGQPPEGRAGRRARLRRRAADPRRADLRARPADGVGVPGLRAGRARAAGRTVLLSSHILAEVEALCDRVSIIRDGPHGRHAARSPSCATSPRTAIDAETARAADGARRASPGVHELDVDGARVRFQVDPDALEPALRALAEAGVRSLVSRPPTLEELFLRHYGRRGMSAPAGTRRAHAARAAARPRDPARLDRAAWRAAVALVAVELRVASTTTAAARRELRRGVAGQPGATLALYGPLLRRLARRAHRVAGGRHHAVLVGADEPPGGRAPHARRRGDRPRASWSAPASSAATRRSPPRCSSPSARTSCSALAVRRRRWRATGLPARRLARARRCARRGRRRVRGRRARSPRSSSRARAPPTRSPARCSASPTCCARPATPPAPHWLSWLSPLGWEPAVAAVRRRPLVVAAAPARASPPRSPPPRRCSPRAATSAPACCPTAPGPAAPARGCAARSRSPGGCSARPLLGWTAGFAAVRRRARRRRLQHRRPRRRTSPGVEKFLAELGGRQGVVDAYLATYRSARSG